MSLSKYTFVELIDPLFPPAMAPIFTPVLKLITAYEVVNMELKRLLVLWNPMRPPTYVVSAMSPNRLPLKEVSLIITLVANISINKNGKEVEKMQKESIDLWATFNYV